MAERSCHRSCKQAGSRRASCLQTLPALLAVCLWTSEVGRLFTADCWDFTAWLNYRPSTSDCPIHAPSKQLSPTHHHWIVGLSGLFPCSLVPRMTPAHPQPLVHWWFLANGFGRSESLPFVPPESDRNASCRAPARKAAGPATHYSSPSFLIQVVPELLPLHSGENSAPASVPHVSRVSFSLGSGEDVMVPFLVSSAL